MREQRRRPSDGHWDEARTDNLAAAVKAITAAQLAMASQNVYSVTLDEAIEAMRLTAADMSVKYKETSLSVGAYVRTDGDKC